MIFSMKAYLVLLLVSACSVGFIILTIYTEHNKIYDHLGERYYRASPGGVIRRIHHVSIRGCQSLNFVQNSIDRLLVALVSFPGSGNTWLRYLLQQATGLLTGSVYNDHGLRMSGMIGEQVANNSVIVIKTHEWGPESRNKYDNAILLIRPPGPAILSEFNRKNAGHLGSAPLDLFKSNNGKDWETFVDERLNVWNRLNHDWVRNFHGTLLVVHYDLLVQHTKDVLEQIIQFLKLPVSQESLQCAIERKEGIYHRRKPDTNFDPFTNDMKRSLQSAWQELNRQIDKQTNMTDTNTEVIHMRQQSDKILETQ